MEGNGFPALCKFYHWRQWEHLSQEQNISYYLNANQKWPEVSHDVRSLNAFIIWNCMIFVIINISSSYIRSMNKGSGLHTKDSKYDQGYKS